MCFGSYITCGKFPTYQHVGNFLPLDFKLWEITTRSRDTHANVNGLPQIVLALAEDFAAGGAARRPVPAYGALGHGAIARLKLREIMRDLREFVLA